MSNCVIKNAEFFNTAKRLRIPANNLEVIVHEYINNGNNDFPSDAYIKSRFYKKPFITSDINIINRWKKYFSSPINLSNMSDVNRKQTIQSAISTFSTDNVIIYTNDNNIEVLVVAIPLYRKSNINEATPEGFTATTFYDEDSYNGDLRFYNTYRKSFTFKKDAEALRDKIQNQYPNRIRVVPDRNNKGQWIVDIKKPTTSDDKFKLYVLSEEIYEDDIYNIDDWADFLSEDDILSNSALEEQDRREQELDEKEDMLFQKKNLLQELDKLKQINHSLRGLGSAKKIKETLKNTGVSPLIYNTIIKAIELDSSLLDLKPYDLFQVISKQQTSDLADLYTQYLQKPINKELEKHLTEFLERYHVDINVGNAVQKFGVAGAYDIINKIIYLANESDRNAITFTEEFAHAFVELMGAKVSRKPENADFTFLFSNVENTKIYKQVYEEYKDTYLTKGGKPDIYKIKKEAIGQALATAINYKWEHRDINKKEESGFWAKLKQWFENILKAFTGAEYLNFDSLISTIAEEIINNNHDRLQKVDSSNYSLLNYSETIANQNKKDDGIAVGFMQYFSELGNIITGSLSYRLQGTVYRASLDALHDIDMIVPKEVHNVPFESTLFKNAIKNNKFGNNVLLDYIKTTEYFKSILEKFPKMKLIASYDDQNTITINAIYCEDESISEQFINMSGTFASRLDKFTEEQRNQIYLFDFFLKSEGVPYIEDKENNFKLALYSESFIGKLVMGRAKDIYDYQNYKLFEEFKGLYTPSTEGMMFQKPQNGFIWNAEQSAAIREVSDFINRRLRGEEKQPFYTIQGKAGTGKTTIINEILRNFQESRSWIKPTIGIGAVSHKAKEVLTNKISEDNRASFKIVSKSLIGLLGGEQIFKKDPKTGDWIEIIEVDMNNPFRNSTFQSATIVFVDEASMVNEQYFELIKEDVKKTNTAVIFIGDVGQLPPVRSDKDPYYKDKIIDQDKLSPVFEDKSIPKSQLVVRVRQGEDSPVLSYADNFWNFSTDLSKKYPIDTLLNIETKITDEGALIVQTKDVDLTQQLLPLFERARREQNPNVVKIVTYKNEAVAEYNKALHFALHPEAAKNNDMNYQEGDLIIFNSNFQLGKITLENSSEGVILKVLREREDRTVADSPVKIRELLIKLNNGDEFRVPVLENSKENINAYYENVEILRQKAQSLPKNSEAARYAWKIFYRFRDSVAQIGYGYAINSHKSQGSTYEVVAVDIAEIEGVKPTSYKTKARSIYTALTRASNVTIVNSSTSKALPPSESISDINDRIIKNKKKGSTSVAPSVEEIKKENNNPPTSSRPADITEPIKKVAEINLNGEQINIEYTYIPNEAVDRLASSDSQGNIFLYKLRGNNEKERLEFFFNYIFGKSEKTYSKQKTQIFKDLANLGYTEQFIRSLITTPKEAFTFLLLHENQHILNKDHVATKNASEQEIYNIEYRATYNALRQLIDSKGVPNPEDSLKKDSAYKILNEIATFNREHLTFDEKSHIYYIDGVPVDTTVTKVLHGEINEDSEYLKISTTLGNVHDNIARDYLSSKNPIIRYDYPNMTEQDVKDFHAQLDKVKDNLDNRFGKGKYEIITDENLLRLVGRITIDGQIKTIAGTMDMLVIDSQGNFHVFDFKTNRANNHIEFTAENSLIYPAQVSMYGQMLSQNYGAKIGSHNLIQLNLKYDTPKGDGRFETGDVVYNVGEDRGQILVTYDNKVTPIQNAYRRTALGSIRIYEPGKLYKIHENVEADPSVLKGKILPYKEVIPERLKDTLENKVTETSKESNFKEESVHKTWEEVMELLGGQEDTQAQQEVKDAIKTAKEGITFEEALGQVQSIFTKEEQEQIKEAIQKTPKKRLQVMSVSRNTDPVFFSKEIIKFLKENSKKDFTDPTRVNVIELWSKHDGMPMQDILEACKKYKVAPMVSFSITGLGDTALEKGVLKYQDLLGLIKELIDNDYLNPSTTTVRIDPILVGVTNMDDIKNIVKEAKVLGIKKFVTSLVQSYGYLEGTDKDRKVISGINKALESEGKSYDWNKYYGRDNRGKINFKPKKEYIDEVSQVLLELNQDSEIEIETCAFSIPGLKPSACLDPLIIERVTGVDVTNPDGTYDRDTSRPECMCYGAHSDMFRWNEKKCFSSCAYCYAAHSGDSNLEYYNEDGSIKDIKYTKVTPRRTQDSEVKNILSSYEFYSGAAKGSDTIWAEEAASLGIKTKNYTEESWDNLSKEWQDKLSKEYEEVARYLARPIVASGTKGGKLVRRDMMQADKADAIFAISTIIKPGEKDKKGYINRSNQEVVEGGTAYAVTRGILRGIPVYVFDQSDNQWKVWDTNTNSFIITSEPTLTPHAATIGTREINDSGRQAIKNILTNSISKISNPPIKEYSDVTYDQIMELFNKNPKKITIEMVTDVFQKHNDKIEILSEEQVEFLNILYKALSQGTPITKNIIPNNTTYSVEKVNSTNDLYTGAVKITLDVNSPKYGRKEALSRILRDLDISNIVYLDGPIGPDFFNTIRWMKQAGLNESSNYRRVYIGNNDSLIESAKSNGLTYNNETGEVYIPAFIVGLKEQELKTIVQNDILLNSDLFTPTELRNLSKAAIFKVSEYITMLTTQEIANEKLLGDDFKDYNFVGKDRIEVIEIIGLSRLFNIVKERFFNTKDERTNDWDFDTVDKADIIYKNFDAFIDLGYDALIGMEGISKYSQTDVSTELDDIIDDKTAQEIQEIYGNSIEHWQVGFRQVSAFSSLSQMIKRTFEKMYVLDNEGNQVINEFGFADTLSPQETVAKVLKWTQYSNSLEEMVSKIKEHQSTDPWVSQLLDKLESNDEEFKSQFYSNFKKYFQKYSIIYRDENSDKILMKMINESSYADTIESEIKGKLSSYAMGNYTLKNIDGTVNIEALEKLKELYDQFNSEESKSPKGIRILEEIYKILDIPVPNHLEFLNNVSNEQFNTAKDKLRYLIKSFEENINNKEFNPLKGGEYKYLIKLSANILGEKLEAVSYEAGKLYYSYVTPSYLNMLIGKLQGHIEDYDTFIHEEYGKYKQFYKDGRYRSYWLQQLVSDKNVRKHLDHKASLHYLGTPYAEKSPDQYIASIMQEYFYDDKNKAWAWYRIPMMSNKPSEEYIKFIRISKGYKEAITDHLIDIFSLEVDRMATVKQREGINKDFKIKNFDTKGSRFVFLDYLNKELDNNTELGILIKRKVLQDPLNPSEQVRLAELVRVAIQKGMDAKYAEEKAFWKKEGFLTETKDGISVKGINLGDTSEQIENSLQEYFWNDTFAAINILQLTITDTAYYENAEDLQKRLAQLHAPGMRGNLSAIDINGQPYTDGYHRSIIINDFEIESEIIPNLEILKQRLLDKETDVVKRALIESQFKDIIKAFKEVNVADAQAYSCPTSYRKKMGIFGKWSAEQERVYNEIKKGNVTPENLAVIWQPLKPFVYGQAEQPGHSNVFDTLKVGYQFKNSEYLLIIADALLRSGNMPNKLSAIFDVMEASADKYPGKGIDTVQFKSAVKAGLTGVIDINSFTSAEEIKKHLESKIYSGDLYSKDYVRTLPMEYFSLQQEVPAHFKGMQQAGSQNRILTIADFPSKDKDGNDIFITINEGTADEETITVEEAKRRYCKAVADNIKSSYDELVRRFKLDNLNPKMQNIAISRVLQDAILKDGRLGPDLLWACSVNKHGEFNIPLSDPTQSDRIQQLLNSIIKNNINKQEIAGGPVVQVSNYGVADELHIRFKDSSGNILMIEEEFNESSIKDNYESYKDYLEKNQSSVAYFECCVPIYDDFIVKDFGRPDGTIDIEAMERTNPDLLKMIGYRIPTEAKYSMVPIKIKGFLPPNAGEGIMLPKEITTLSGSDFDIDKLYIMRYMFDRKESFDRTAFIDHLTSNKPEANKNKINDILNRNLAGEEFEEGSLEMGIFDYYVEHKKEFTKVEYTKVKSGKHANNNELISIQYAILTHENSLEQLFTPGNFNVPKKLGYLIDVLKNMPNSELRAEDIDTVENYKLLSEKSIYDLKDLSTKDKNLIYSSVHVQFHKQNMTAGKLIGIFATGNVSHAFMSLIPCYTNIDETDSFVINGKQIVGEVRIDPEFDESGNRVSSNLASFLAASVDAVKDPVLNLLNINTHTANILMTLLRLGFDTETACLLLSQPIVGEVLKKLTLSEDKNFIGDVISEMKKALADNIKVEPSATFDFTKEFFIENLLVSNEINDLYILDLLEKVLSLSDLFKDITNMTKYNSITNAVGPFASDTEYRRLQIQAFKNNSMVTDSIRKAVNNPILQAFRDYSYSIEQALLGENIIQAHPKFKIALSKLQGELGYITNELSNKFSNFFIDYILSMNDGVFDMSYENRKKVLLDFPSQILGDKDTYSDNILMQNIKYVTDNNGFSSLELRTRGLSSEQEQDIIASWAKLYKENPDLAIQILEYNVMKGTFGFNPKTFTKYVPNILKQGLPRYVEKLNVRNIPELTNENYEQIIIQFMLNNGLKPAGTHYLKNFEGAQKISDTEFYIRNSKKDTINRGGVGVLVIEDKSHTAYFEKVSYDTYKVTLIDSLGGNGKAVELNPKERFPKSVFGDDYTSTKQGSSEQSFKKDLSVRDIQGILLSKLYSIEELQEISQYNLQDDRVKRDFLLQLEGRYAQSLGRKLKFAESAFFWNNAKGFQDLINLLASSNSSDYIKLLGGINSTLDELNLCNN